MSSTVTHPTLAQALDKQIEDLQQRARIIIMELKNDAKIAALDFQSLADETLHSGMANHRIDMERIRCVLAYQARLDEVNKACGALAALRGSYAPEIHEASR